MTVKSYMKKHKSVRKVNAWAAKDAWKTKNAAMLAARLLQRIARGISGRKKASRVRSKRRKVVLSTYSGPRIKSTGGKFY